MRSQLKRLLKWRMRRLIWRRHLVKPNQLSKLQLITYCSSRPSRVLLRFKCLPSSSSLSSCTRTLSSSLCKLMWIASNSNCSWPSRCSRHLNFKSLRSSRFRSFPIYSNNRHFFPKHRQRSNCHLCINSNSSSSKSPRHRQQVKKFQLCRSISAAHLPSNRWTRPRRQINSRHSNHKCHKSRSCRWRLFRRTKVWIEGVWTTCSWRIWSSSTRARASSKG